MAQTRKDLRGRVLRKGESQRRSDGRYVYTYTDPLGRRKYVYAQDLVALREKEAQLMKDQMDGLDIYVAGKATVNFVFDRYFRAVKVKECVAVPKSKKLLQFTLDDGTGTDRTILSGIHSFYEPEKLVGKTLIAITNLPPRAMMGIDSCGMLLSAIHEEEGEEKLHLLMVDDHIPAGAKLY